MFSLFENVIAFIPNYLFCNQICTAWFHWKTWSLAKGTSNTSPMPSLYWIEQSHPGGGSLNVAQSLVEMTASLASAASLALEGLERYLSCIPFVCVCDTINQHFWWSCLFDLPHLLTERSRVALVNNTRNVTKNVFWNKRLPNVT